MSNVLILGANGQIARNAIDLFLDTTDANLTLFLRNASRLNISNPDREHVIEGDVTDIEKLKEAMVGQDVIYANLGGSDFVQQAESIVEAMHAANKKRIIFISSLGIYDEVPGKFGEWHKNTLGEILVIDRKAADVIEASDLDYTILRPA